MVKFFVFFALILTGCENVNGASNKARERVGVASPTLKTLPSYPQLIAINYSIAEEFFKEADLASNKRDIANGLLLIATVGVIQNGGLGDKGADVANQTLIALGLSEGIRYSRPNSAASAFVVAAEQSACLAGVASTSLGADSDKRNALWEMMVQGNLRRSLKRDHVSVVTIVSSILGRDNTDMSDRLTREENKTRANNLRTLIASDVSDEKNNIRYLLLGCFTT